MKHFLITSVAAILFTTGILAQSYVKSQTRHRFAQLNLGVDYLFMPSANTQSTFINDNSQPENFQLDNGHQARLIFGGTHFWGHADFYVAVPIASFGKSYFVPSVETGAKYYPWRLQRNKIRPFIGAAFIPSLYQQGDGTSKIKNMYPVLGGISYAHKLNIIELGLTYNFLNSYQYYISPTQQTTVKTHPLWFTLAFKYMLETTATAEDEWLNGNTKRKTDSLAHTGKLNSFYIAAGPSASFYTSESEYNNQTKPYLDNHIASNIFADLSVGYYHHFSDAQINLAYRNVNSNLKAYGSEQKLNRKSLSIEFQKFLFDYHGFVPFIGVSFSKEWLNVQESTNNIKTIDESSTAIKPGISFGWDIRPNRLQTFIIRTNLRYVPNLSVKMPNGQLVNFNQLEFNFIQLVLYPQRIFGH